MTLHRTLWALQVVLACIFFVIGTVHFSRLNVPYGSVTIGPLRLWWMGEASNAHHVVAGTLEVLGSLGLVLPPLARLEVRLVAIAAAELSGLMAVNAVWQVLVIGAVPPLVRLTVAVSLLLGLLCAFVAYGRARLRPLL